MLIQLGPLQLQQVKVVVMQAAEVEEVLLGVHRQVAQVAEVLVVVLRQVETALQIQAVVVEAARLRQI
jgi:hypothetical protein